MKVETTLDKVILDHQEVSKIIRDHLEAKLNRKIKGDLNFTHHTHRNGEVGAWAWLQPQPQSVDLHVG